ncbi:alpha/beta fold hydrolase [Sulfuricella sp. T08]|uniref:alpha/beta fold hydrolase n=1 Tax=Sulfuricella sp. T08 TaxID=1632857 RepID=UPI0009E3419B|nr:alpha/beta hydrolase [Sulfuricella sp. T08]
MNATTKLVLLPGLDGTEILFGPLLRHLPSWIDPVVITYPASGINNYENLLPIIIREVTSLNNFVVLGWSFGGPLALMVAAQCPSQVSGVVLCGSFVTSPRPGLVPFRFAVRAPLIAVVRALRRTRLLIPGYASTEFRRAKAMTWKRVNSRTLASRSRAALSVDVRHQLRACRAKLMYLASTRDEVVSRNSLNEILAIAPQTQVAEVEGPHFALFTNPVKSVDCIVEFLRAKNLP